MNLKSIEISEPSCFFSDSSKFLSLPRVALHASHQLALPHPTPRCCREARPFHPAVVEQHVEHAIIKPPPPFHPPLHTPLLLSSTWNTLFSTPTPHPAVVEKHVLSTPLLLSSTWNTLLLSRIPPPPHTPTRYHQAPPPPHHSPLLLGSTSTPPHLAVVEQHVEQAIISPPSTPRFVGEQVLSTAVLSSASRSLVTISPKSRLTCDYTIVTSEPPPQKKDASEFLMPLERELRF